MGQKTARTSTRLAYGVKTYRMNVPLQISVVHEIEVDRMTNDDAVVLLVEDCPEDALITQRALKGAGVEQRIIHLEDGEQAIEYLRGETPYNDREQYPLPALVLLDLKMPKVTGLEVLEWLQAQPDLARKVPVIVLTGSIHPRDRTQAAQFGAVGYEVKPVDFKQLVGIAESLKERMAKA